MTWHPDMPQEFRNQIVTGDARVLAERIPDESVDLIFTDPVYDRIDDYRWLAETAARVLKPDRACFVFCGIEWIPQELNALGEYLAYRWQFSFTPVQAGGSRFWSGMMRRCWIAGVWFEKGTSKLYGRIFDSMALPSGHNQTGHGNRHKWEKGLKWMRFVGRAFCPKDGIALDPFTGSGTIPAVCKQLGRNYVAFEIDPNTAELARERVRNTQPPLFVPEPEQMELEL